MFLLVVVLFVAFSFFANFAPPRKKPCELEEPRGAQDCCVQTPSTRFLLSRSSCFLWLPSRSVKESGGRSFSLHQETLLLGLEL